ncbi:cytochrome b/b6 domain-containing protein [Niallia sp. XMNu-256]|uniref:formate dehydrogenase subunit gamma n=1 Tax=Niallia sp. XMNu-256 TaxID=3082444 RepID=UPI0030D152F9
MSKRKPKIVDGKVKRFSIHFMIFHWGYAISYFVLYLTGLAMYTEFFDWLYVLFGGPAMARLIHRGAAIAFVLFPIYMLIFDRKSMFHWLKNAFKWGKHDIKYLMNFPFDMFGFKVKNPPQDFISGGEKLNSLMQIFTFFMFVASGVVMWVPQYFPGWAIDWSYPIHNIALGLSFMVIIGHIYLSSKNPSSKASLEGMTTGYCSEDYAKHHHENWYNEIVAEEEQARKEEEKNQNKGA